MLANQSLVSSSTGSTWELPKIRGNLILGSLYQGSYYLGYCIRVSYFRKTPTWSWISEASPETWHNSYQTRKTWPRQVKEPDSYHTLSMYLTPKPYTLNPLNHGTLSFLCRARGSAVGGRAIEMGPAGCLGRI